MSADSWRKGLAFDERLHIQTNTWQMCPKTRRTHLCNPFTSTAKLITAQQFDRALMQNNHERLLS